jgi:hypothetical protein
MEEVDTIGSTESTENLENSSNNRKIYDWGTISREGRYKVENALHRDWISELSGAQYKVLVCIFSRTIGWNNLRCVVAKAEIAKDTNLSLGTVKSSLAFLDDNGYLKRTHRIRKWVYEINLEKVDDMALKISKKNKVGVQKTTPLGGIKNNPSIEEDNTKEDKKDIGVPSETPTTKVRSRIESIKNKERDKRKKLAYKAKKKKLPTLQEIEAVWQEETKTLYPSKVIVSWSSKERGQMMHFLKGSTFPSHVTKAEVIAWMVLNWQFIVEQEFHWMGKKKGYDPAPSEPKVGFLLRWRETFAEWYSKRNEFEGRRELFANDRQREELRRKGYTEEEIDSRQQRSRGEFATVSKSKVLPLDARKPLKKKSDKVDKRTLRIKPTKEDENQPFILENVEWED